MYYGQSDANSGVRSRSARRYAVIAAVSASASCLFGQSFVAVRRNICRASTGRYDSAGARLLSSVRCSCLHESGNTVSHDTLAHDKVVLCAWPWLHTVAHPRTGRENCRCSTNQGRAVDLQACSGPASGAAAFAAIVRPCANRTLGRRHERLGRWSAADRACGNRIAAPGEQSPPCGDRAS